MRPAPAWSPEDAAQHQALVGLMYDDQLGEHMAAMDMPWQYLEPMDGYDADTR